MGKKITKKEERFVRARRELESGKNERTGEPLTRRKRRRNHRILNKWYKNCTFNNGRLWK